MLCFRQTSRSEETLFQIPGCLMKIRAGFSRGGEHAPVFLAKGKLAAFFLGFGTDSYALGQSAEKAGKPS